MTEIQMPSAQASHVRAALYAAGRRRLFAIVDGARDPRILPLLADSGASFTCLYEGRLAPRLARAAPQLAELDTGSSLLMDLIMRGWGRAWGAYLVSDAALEPLRQHLRGLLRVTDPEGAPLWFRYYDPRVLRVYLPSCTAREAQQVFGPVDRFLVEGPDGSEVLGFAPGAHSVLTSVTPIAAPTRGKAAP